MTEEELEKSKNINNVLGVTEDKETIEEPKKRGRKPGVKNELNTGGNAEIASLIDLVKSLNEELKKVKEDFTEQKLKQSLPVSVRLDNKQKRHGLPPYSGEIKRVKFMRNEQQDSPMPIWFSSIVFNEEKGIKEHLDWRPKDENGENSKGLLSGEIYEVPAPVIDFINSRSEPIYGERPHPTKPQHTRTVIVGQKDHCYCIPL